MNTISQVGKTKIIRMYMMHKLDLMDEGYNYSDASKVSKVFTHWAFDRFYGACNVENTIVSFETSEPEELTG
jgi:hypothetical protein